MLKRNYVSGQSFLSRYKRIIGLAVCMLIVIFLLGSLSSYNPYDASLFYYSSSAQATTNIFGFMGAHVAALLFYLCGGAAYLFIGLAAFCFWLLSINASWRHEWDRLTAWLLLIMACATISFYFHWDIVKEVTPGGLVGRVMYGVFARWFDTTGILFAGALLMIALIVLLRFALAPLFFSMRWLFNLVTNRKRFWIPLYTAVIVVIIYGVALFKKIINYFYRVFSGSLIEDEQQSIFEFEYDREEEHTQNEWDAAVQLQSMDVQTADIQGVTSPLATTPVIEQKITAHSSINTLGNSVPVFGAPMEEQQPYTLPNIDIFIGVPQEHDDRTLMQELEKRARILEEKLERFSVYGKVTAIKRGPVVTVYEYQPDIDSKISKIIALEDDLSLALQALSIRIIAPIPGRAVVGFEVANTKRKNVSFAKIIKSNAYQNFVGALPLLLGEDTIGNDVVVDLARMPHLLIAGSTGSGKSVALNGMLTSLLCKHRPDELKLVLIDPKRLEFAPYADIPHLLFPIITESKKVAPVLRFVIREMEERYERMAGVGARNIFDYHNITGERSSMPFMVMVIDELADLMMTAGREIEDLITRIAQMARAAGIHMLVATQRPSVDVITGLIKVNFPSRISFRVTSKIDSRTILDCAGADKLLGRGDMLFLDSSSASMKRIHGAFVSDAEIANVVNHLRAQQKPNYIEYVCPSYTGFS